MNLPFQCSHFKELASLSVLSSGSPLLSPPSQYPFRYRVYGLTLATDLRLNLPDADGSEAAMELGRGEGALFSQVRKTIPRDPTDWVQHGILKDGALYMQWGSWFEILVSPDGRRVLCNNLGEIPLESFEAYLTNFAVSAALLQQGEETLHATVVEISGRAIGLLGPSGAGKSTLAAFLINKGGTLVTDDMLRVTFEHNIAFAQPGPPRIKLFRETADRYLLKRSDVGYWNPLGQKMIFEPGDQPSNVGPQRLSALYYLEVPSPTVNSDSPILEQLVGVELFRTILSSSMDFRLHSPEGLKRQFRFAEQLAKEVPLFRLTYSRNFDFIDQVAGRIYELAQL